MKERVSHWTSSPLKLMTCLRCVGPLHIGSQRCSERFVLVPSRLNFLYVSAFSSFSNRITVLLQVYRRISGTSFRPAEMLSAIVKEHQSKQVARKERQGETCESIICLISISVNIS